MTDNTRDAGTSGLSASPMDEVRERLTGVTKRDWMTEESQRKLTSWLQNFIPGWHDKALIGAVREAIPQLIAKCAEQAAKLSLANAALREAEALVQTCRESFFAEQQRAMKAEAEVVRLRSNNTGLTHELYKAHEWASRSESELTTLRAQHDALEAEAASLRMLRARVDGGSPAVRAKDGSIHWGPAMDGEERVLVIPDEEPRT